MNSASPATSISAATTPDGTLNLDVMLPSSPGMVQYNPLIACDGAGNFAVAWQRLNGDGSTSLMLQRYSSGGTLQGSSLEAARTSSYFQGADLAMDNSGNAVLVWSDGASSGAAIMGVFYDASGVRQGRPMALVAADDGHTLRYPSVAMDGTGNFVLAWQSVDGRGTVATMARRFAKYVAPELIPPYVVSVTVDGNPQLSLSSTRPITAASARSRSVSASR